MGETTSWSETEKIDRVRRAHTQRHAQTQSTNGTNQETNHKKMIPCVHFNKNTCLQKQTHETKGVLYKHICSACWSTESKAYIHILSLTVDARRQKRVGQGTTHGQGSRVHNTRYFYGAPYQKHQIQSLCTKSKSELKKTSIAAKSYVNLVGKRSYSQVVAAISDPLNMVSSGDFNTHSSANKTTKANIKPTMARKCTHNNASLASHHMGLNMSSSVGKLPQTEVASHTGQDDAPVHKGSVASHSSPEKHTNMYHGLNIQLNNRFELLDVDQDEPSLYIDCAGPGFDSTGKTMRARKNRCPSAHNPTSSQAKNNLMDV